MTVPNARALLSVCLPAALDLTIPCLPQTLRYQLKLLSSDYLTSPSCVVLSSLNWIAMPVGKLCEPGLIWVGSAYSQAKLRKAPLALPSMSVASLSISLWHTNPKCSSP